MSTVVHESMYFRMYRAFCHNRRLTISASLSKQLPRSDPKFNSIHRHPKKYVIRRRRPSSFRPEAQKVRPFEKFLTSRQIPKRFHNFKWFFFEKFPLGSKYPIYTLTLSIEFLVPRWLKFGPLFSQIKHGVQSKKTWYLSSIK